MIEGKRITECPLAGVHQFGRRAPVSSFLKSSEKFKYKASKKFNENMGM
jgi:hypothetical protein